MWPCGVNGRVQHENVVILDYCIRLKRLLLTVDQGCGSTVEGASRQLFIPVYYEMLTSSKI